MRKRVHHRKHNKREHFPKAPGRDPRADAFDVKPVEAEPKSPETRNVKKDAARKSNKTKPDIHPSEPLDKASAAIPAPKGGSLPDDEKK
jgi:hypothetical protein